MCERPITLTLTVNPHPTYICDSGLFGCVVSGVAADVRGKNVLPPPLLLLLLLHDATAS